MKHVKLIRLTVLIFPLIILGCAASRPVLYPNSHLNTVGMQVADSDIDACMSMAKNAGADNQVLSEVASETAEGGIIGGATGAAVGAVIGRAGQGAATGAAGGATARLTESLFDSDEPNWVFQKFVDRCLMDKGYDLVGWN